MTFALFAAAIALSTFAVVSTVVSLAVACFGAVATTRTERYAPDSRAALLFRIRMLPAAAAAVAALGIALPIFVAFEPRHSGESLARTLLVLALVGVALLIRGAWRAAHAWILTRRVQAEWQRRGRPVDGFDTQLPVFAIDDAFPTVAVVGVTRPAFFISERVLRECTAGEVRAMLRHEAAHVTGRDNFKRFLIRACPDVLRPGGPLERAWACAAEEAADAVAVANRPSTAVDLAQALIRVARLAPARATPALASAFYPGGSIESRVRRLVDPSPPPEPPRSRGCVALLAGALCLAATIVAAAPLLHQLMEVLVHRLP